VAETDKMADQISQRRYANRSARERSAERHARLLRAGVDCFSRLGFSDTSIEQLCTAAKVSTRSFYQEFGSREAILIELHDTLEDAAFAAVRQARARAATEDIVGAVRAGLVAYFEVMTKDPAWTRVVLVDSVGASPVLEPRRQRVLDRFAGLIVDETRDLVAAGVLADRDYSLTAVAIVGAIKELITTWARTSGLALDDIVDEAVRISLSAMTATTFDR
jgi:AcrR family transcriptional regulator